MRNSTVFRSFLVSVPLALALGSGSLFALRSLNESSSHEIWGHMTAFLAQTLESGPYAESIQSFHQQNAPHAGRPARRFNNSSLWVFSGTGEVIASNTDKPLPVRPEELAKPATAHDFTLHYRAFSLVPDLITVKLDAKEDTYLLIDSRRRPSFQGLLLVQAGLVLFIVGTSILVALGLIYTYMKGRSREARAVLARLEKGDLKARFEIKRIDEVGTLMLDFNRMASEIERLVLRVQETETARKNLLSELSHDLRTPLTGLKASIETLSEYWEKMPSEERRELLAVGRTELGYLIHLIDDLFLIADLGEPRYKKTSLRIALPTLLLDEIRLRESQGKGASPETARVRWETNAATVRSENGIIQGDPLLIQRLFKNAMDNAGHHARQVVRLSFQVGKDNVTVLIDNDGQEISDEAIANFALRRRDRYRHEEHEKELSLGLGSVIMKTIIELHGGSITIGRISAAQDGLQGTRLTLRLPKGLSS